MGDRPQEIAKHLVFHEDLSDKRPSEMCEEIAWALRDYAREITEAMRPQIQLLHDELDAALAVAQALYSPSANPRRVHHPFTPLAPPEFPYTTNWCQRCGRSIDMHVPEANPEEEVVSE